MGGVLKTGSVSSHDVALRLELPLQLAQPVGTAQTPAPQWPLPSAMRVLVAEDNSAAQIVMRHYLNELRMDVSLVADGVQAWQAAVDAHQAGTPFDLLIAKHELPGLDGSELARLLQANDALARTTRLVLTAPIDQRPDPQLPASAVAAWIPKPIRRSTLRTALTHLFATDLAISDERLARASAIVAARRPVAAWPSPVSVGAFDDSNWLPAP